MTQQGLADQLGVSERTVRPDAAEKVRTHKKAAGEPRKVTQYKISQYTTPETAAAKIRDKFGDALVDAMKQCL